MRSLVELLTAECQYIGQEKLLPLYKMPIRRGDTLHFEKSWRVIFTTAKQAAQNVGYHRQHREFWCKDLFKKWCESRLV